MASEANRLIPSSAGKRLICLKPQVVEGLKGTLRDITAAACFLPHSWLVVIVREGLVCWWLMRNMGC